MISCSKTSKTEILVLLKEMVKLIGFIGEGKISLKSENWKAKEITEDRNAKFSFTLKKNTKWQVLFASRSFQL